MSSPSSHFRWRASRRPPFAVFAFFAAFLPVAGLLGGACLGHRPETSPPIAQWLTPGRRLPLSVPSSRSRSSPVVVAVQVPESGALWIEVACPGVQGDAVWLQGQLRDPRDPGVRFPLVPTRRGGVLKVPRVDAGVAYTMAIINLGAQTLTCDVIERVVPVSSLASSPVPLDTEEVARGVLFPWPGLDTRTFLVAVPERARVAVDVRAEVPAGTLALAWRDDAGGVLEGRERLEIADVPPGVYHLDVVQSQDTPPTRFAVVLSVTPVCEPEPVTLDNRRWHTVTLMPGGCRAAFVGRIRIDHATEPRLDLETTHPERITVRYRAPDRPWQDLSPRSQPLSTVSTFGWHQIEVRLRPEAAQSGGLLPVEVSLRMSYPQPCSSLSGRIFDVRGTTVFADLHRWQGVRAGMRGYLEHDGGVVGHVEVVGVSAKATVLRVLACEEPPRVGFRVVFPCQ